MRAVLRLEIIGDNWHQYRRMLDAGKLGRTHFRDDIRAIRYGRRQLRPWVARLIGVDNCGFQREFITGMRDYSLARGIGLRGIYEYFALKPGVYEVNECVRLGYARRYFIRVDNLDIIEVPRTEVLECLKSDD